jgi:hypothetical protein
MKLPPDFLKTTAPDKLQGIDLAAITKKVKNRLEREKAKADMLVPSWSTGIRAKRFFKTACFNSR